jgi:hypothetical protein
MEQKRVNQLRYSPEYQEKLETLKKIYNLKTNNKILELLVDAELRRQ